MNNLHAMINGQLVLEKDAALRINDLSIVRGYGIFDFFKTIESCPVFFQDNLDRFFHSAKIMDLPIPFSREELTAQIQAIIKINNIPDSGIKLLLTGGYSPDAYTIAKPNLIITQQPLKINQQQQKEGIKLITYDFQRSIPEAKTIDYTMGIKALKSAKEKGADDVVYINSGVLTECPRANIFIFNKNNELITPAHNVLKGITRKHLLRIGKELFTVKEQTITYQDLEHAKEAFVCSTTKDITPVLEIDSIRYGDTPGNLTKALQKAWKEELRKQIQSFTPVS